MPLASRPRSYVLRRPPSTAEARTQGDVAAYLHTCPPRVVRPARSRRVERVQSNHTLPNTLASASSQYPQEAQNYRLLYRLTTPAIPPYYSCHRRNCRAVRCGAVQHSTATVPAGCGAAAVWRVGRGNDLGGRRWSGIQRMTDGTLPTGLHMRHA